MNTPWVDPLIFATACLGGGGFLLSLCVGLVPNFRRPAAIAAHALMATLALLAAAFAVLAAAALQPISLWGPAATLAALYVLLVLLPRPALAHWSGQPATRRATRLVAMLGLWALCPFAALGLVYTQIDPPAVLDNETLAAMLADESAGPAPVLELNSPLRTDQGRCIATLRLPPSACQASPERLAMQARLLARHELDNFVMYQPDGWQSCNCHGYTFTGGRFAIPGHEVDGILEDNGYQPSTLAQPGDVAVYRDENGQITHTGIVRALAADRVILIESKWGMAGRFIHAHDRHPYSGSVCTFYRSSRTGHLLVGADSISTDPTALPSEARQQ